ncbi:hypothetical protein N7470_007555 [Penicillium chermesinum]|nr:hypothetical protein N7470_007555 [Penicillium chermesinum]
MASGRISPVRPSIRLSPSHSRANSRSTSPERNPGSLYPKIDPLLSNLSPESTLNALTSTDAVPSDANFSHDVLSQSISQVSPGERALGIRAAIAARNLNSWYREVQSWTWPAQKDAKEGKGFVPPGEPHSGAGEYYGSLPATTVEQYELRIDEIRDEMDNLNVEELKEHVLNAHIPSRSRPSSAASIASMPPPLSYVQLSDFTAVVTATILRALPYLSRLSSLLATWDVRLLVLRQVPGLLRELEATRTLLNSSFDALRIPDCSNTTLNFTCGSEIDNAKIKLELAVVSGRQDSLPEQWIDDLEAIESEFAAWVVEAERYKLRIEWLAKEKAKEDELSQDVEPEPEQERPLETQRSAPTESEIQNETGTATAPAEEVPKIEVEDITLAIEEPSPELETNASRMEVEQVAPAAEYQGEKPEPIAPKIGAEEVTTSTEEPLAEPEPVILKVQLNELIPAVEEPCAEPKPPVPNLELDQTVRMVAEAYSEPEPIAPKVVVSRLQAGAPIIEPRGSSPTEKRSEKGAHIESENINPEVEESQRVFETPQDALLVLTNHEVEDPEPIGHESFLSTDSDSVFPEVSDPDTSLSPRDRDIMAAEMRVNEEPRESPKSPRSVVPESIQTPTQPKFPRERSINTPTSASPSPSRIPLPVTPKVENKENIRPHMASHRFTPTRLAIVESIEKDPFTQTPIADGRPTSPSAAAPRATDVRLSDVEPGQAFKQNVGEHHGIEDDETLQKGSGSEASQLAVQDELVNSLETPSRVKLADDPPARDAVSHKTPTEKPSEALEVPERKAPQSDSLQVALQSTVEKNADPGPSKKKPLQSPIKLSKSRPARLSLDKKSPKGRTRRPSTVSINSISDNSSLASDPAEIAPRTGSSGEAPPLPQIRPEFIQPDYTSSRDYHVLRGDHLRRLENRNPHARPILHEDRSVSLPLERFINEKLDLDLNPEQVPEVPRLRSAGKASVPVQSSRGAASTPTTQALSIPKRRPALSRGKSSSNLRDSDSVSVASSYDINRPTFGQNTARRALHHHEQPRSVRLQKRLTAHRSLESLGLQRHELDYVEEDESELLDPGSRTSSRKINSILSTLPGRIHLVDPSNEADTSSSSSSMDRKMRERYLSESPRGPQSRSVTPAPSLTLMPAARRRLSHAHKTEDSYVKLYHLHHGGQAAPTKLFVRTVGEDGQRVMVRVGGGWADLGEYLREYVIHHGRRKVSETPLVEVQGLAPRSSPGYPSPTTLFSPPPSTHISGRATPSRPPSALSARPASSLTVRKTRRGSNASDAVAARSVTTGTLHLHASPPAPPSTRRRLSISSTYSSGGPHTPGHPSTGPHEARSAPLGLAGPKPRSRQVSMSPEGEAWVENVLQKTRRSTSLNPPPLRAERVSGP